ncbi:hypothetical protein C8R46DRAFT_1062209 [Mycena filopes]|nr:hypothetical protein C8R46DRAFT_1062209 [Mycena filopes]
MPITARALEPRSITLVPTATSGVPASTQASHSARPSPTRHLKSDKQHKAPVGLIIGVAIAILAGVAALFFVRWLFVRRARRRAAFAGQGRTLGGPAAPRPSTAKQQQPMSAAPPVSQPQTYPAPPQAYAMPTPAPALAPASERDAVELGAYPPQLPPTHATTGSWGTPFAGAAPSNTTGPEPGANSSPAARQAYLAAELRAAQAQLERTPKNAGAETKALKARIRGLEERQTSAWAMGLE